MTTGAAARDRRFRRMADRMIRGPRGFGIPATITPNTGTTDPLTDVRTPNGIPIPVHATPTVPVTEAHLADSRVQTTDAVTIVGGTELSGILPEPGWTFAYAGERELEVVAVPSYRSGYEFALHELVVRG